MNEELLFQAFLNQDVGMYAQERSACTHESNATQHLTKNNSLVLSRNPKKRSSSSNISIPVPQLI